MSYIRKAERLLRQVIYFFVATIFVLNVFLLTIVVDVLKKLLFKEEVKFKGKAVFITGCDEGYGIALAKCLDSKGFHVFAACLFPAGTGAKELKNTCSERLHVLHMDVTKDESVQKAFEYLKNNLGSNELWALVNNAGMVKGFSVDFSSMDDFRDCMEFNLLGQVRVTKAFLPLLKQTKGRIVNVTSAAGKLPLPCFTPYSISKYAAVGFNDCLRHEVEPWGISVIAIEPELFVTGLASSYITLKNLDSKLKGLSSSFKEDYGVDFATSFKDITKVFLSFASPKIDLVVKDLELAVSLKRPFHTYKPRRHLLARFICFCYEVMPTSCQNLLMKLVFFVFFSKYKEIKNIVMTTVSLL